jgi:hypothetical protein
MKLRCVCCGNILSEEEAESCAYPLQPLSCYDCREEVAEEEAKWYPMWPSGWYGHCSQRNDRRWATWENQNHV